MRYFMDTEYTDDGERFELISIALVSDDGREYYAAVEGFDRAAVTPWVEEHVLPQLPPAGDSLWKGRSQIRDEIEAFVTGPNIEFWTMCAWVDWLLLVRLFGHFEDVPAGWPMACWDLWQLEAELGVARGERVPEPADVHNALADARWHRKIYQDLRSRVSR
ncbi:MAG: 3'-5' exoribonuclease [Actinomycetota bacterium]